MRNCPNCGQPVADGVQFCQACGGRIPAPQVPVKAPAKKESNGGVIAAWAALVVNLLVLVMLIGCTVGLVIISQPQSELDRLDEQLAQLEAVLDASADLAPTDPVTTDPIPADPLPTDLIPADPVPTMDTEIEQIQPSILETVPVAPAGDTTVHVKAPESWQTVYIWAWRYSDDKWAFDQWPGEPADPEGVGHTMDLPGWADTIVISDAGWYETGDISFTPGEEIWVQIGDDGDVTVWYDEPYDWDRRPVQEAPEIPAAPEGYVNVCARIPEAWGNTPHCWGWNFQDQTNAFDWWPGEPMTWIDGWYVICVPNWCDGIIINDGGSRQTMDLMVTPGKDLWIDVYSVDNVTVSYEYPG